MAQPIYNCSQNTFVTAATKGIKLCMTHSSELVTVKPLLVVPYFEQMLLDLKAADLMPDANTRRGWTDLAFIVYDKDRNAFFKLFALLKTHIEEGNDPEKHEALLLGAGNDNYAKAKAGSWNDLSGVISSARPFVEEHKADLIAQNLMPPTFPEAIETAMQNVEVSYAKWDALSKGLSKADPKIEAFNAIHIKLAAALKVGNIHFADTNPALSKQFVFVTLVSQTQGVRNAGLSGKIIGTNKAALKKAVIIIEGSDKVAETDEDGKFEISPLSMGKYRVIVECPGYETQIFEEVKIKTGVTTRLNVQLVVVAAATA